MYYIDAKTAHNLYSYKQLIEKLFQAHTIATDVVEDLLLESDDNESKNHFFIRAAWQKNNCLGSKVITIFPQNRLAGSPPSIQALYTLFDGKTGTPLACIDGTALTFLKTATDSALGTQLLAREDVKTMLMIGAGSMAPHLIEAHCSARPSIDSILIWNRTEKNCEPVIRELADKGIKVNQTEDLESAIKQADLISSAVTSTQPNIKGAWLKQGCHLDLVGAFKEELREADNEAIKRASIFVDSKKMTFGIVGEIMIPIKEGVITESDVNADFYDAVNNKQFSRKNQSEITLFKNSGGGHLDLMMAQILYTKYIQTRKNHEQD